MVQPWITQQAIEGYHPPALFIPRPKDEAVESAVHNSPGAHRTGLNGHIKVTPIQAVISNPCGAGAQYQDLGVGSEIMQGDGAVMISGNDLAIAHQDRTYGNLPFPRRRQRLFYGQLHQLMICQ